MKAAAVQNAVCQPQIEVPSLWLAMILSKDTRVRPMKCGSKFIRKAGIFLRPARPSGRPRQSKHLDRRLTEQHAVENVNSEDSSAKWNNGSVTRIGITH